MSEKMQNLMETNNSTKDNCSCKRPCDGSCDCECSYCEMQYKKHYSGEDKYEYGIEFDGNLNTEEEVKQDSLNTVNVTINKDQQIQNQQKPIESITIEEMESISEEDFEEESGVKVELKEAPNYNYVEDELANAMTVNITDEDMQHKKLTLADDYYKETEESSSNDGYDFDCIPTDNLSINNGLIADKTGDTIIPNKELENLIDLSTNEEIDTPIKLIKPVNKKEPATIVMPVINSVDTTLNNSISSSDTEQPKEKLITEDLKKTKTTKQKPIRKVRPYNKPNINGLTEEEILATFINQSISQEQMTQELTQKQILEQTIDDNKKINSEDEHYVKTIIGEQQIVGNLQKDINNSSNQDRLIEEQEKFLKKIKEQEKFLEEQKQHEKEQNEKELEIQEKQDKERQEKEQIKRELELQELKELKEKQEKEQIQRELELQDLKDQQRLEQQYLEQQRIEQQEKELIQKELELQEIKNKKERQEKEQREKERLEKEQLEREQLEREIELQELKIKKEQLEKEQELQELKIKKEQLKNGNLGEEQVGQELFLEKSISHELFSEKPTSQELFSEKPTSQELFLEEQDGQELFLEEQDEEDPIQQKDNSSEQSFDTSKNIFSEPDTEEQPLLDDSIEIVFDDIGTLDGGSDLSLNPPIEEIKDTTNNLLIGFGDFSENDSYHDSYESKDIPLNKLTVDLKKTISNTENNSSDLINNTTSADSLETLEEKADYESIEIEIEESEDESIEIEIDESEESDNEDELFEIDFSDNEADSFEIDFGGTSNLESEEKTYEDDSYEDDSYEDDSYEDDDYEDDDYEDSYDDDDDDGDNEEYIEEDEDDEYIEEDEEYYEDEDEEYIEEDEEYYDDDDVEYIEEDEEYYEDEDEDYNGGRRRRNRGNRNSNRNGNRNGNRDNRRSRRRNGRENTGADYDELTADFEDDDYYDESSASKRNFGSRGRKDLQRVRSIQKNKKLLSRSETRELIEEEISDYDYNEYRKTSAGLEKNLPSMNSKMIIACLSLLGAYLLCMPSNGIANVTGDSMYPTLIDGDSVTYKSSRIIPLNLITKIEVGDIVIVRTAWSNNLIVKRITEINSSGEYFVESDNKDIDTLDSNDFGYISLSQIVGVVETKNLTQ